jgi:hypothetical protein
MLKGGEGLLKAAHKLMVAAPIRAIEHFLQQLQFALVPDGPLWNVHHPPE